MDEFQELRENPKLMELAKAAAEMSDLTADEAMDQILNTPHFPSEPPANFSFRDAWEKYAKALGKPWMKLTVEERQQAIINAILVEDHIDG